MHYAVRFKGKFHIIINKIFFSTIIFNPKACMYIDLFFKIYIQFVWNTLACLRPILEGNLVIVLVY